MLARRTLPIEYSEWNKRWGAPFGYPPRTAQRFWGKWLPHSMRTRLAGPFSIQKNSQTRTFEYPWAFHAAPVRTGMRVVDVGGGLGGLQFVLSKAGATVVNVDPGLEAEGKGWKCDQADISFLNRVFGTSVQLRNCTLKDALLEKNAYDIVYSISVMEHLTEKEFWETTGYVWDILRPGGRFVATVDLFLNLLPFSTRKRNEYGTNYPLADLTTFETFTLVCGDPKEIYGTEQFNKDQILSHLEDYYVGEYPGLAQCLVLEKG